VCIIRTLLLQHKNTIYTGSCIIFRQAEKVSAEQHLKAMKGYKLAFFVINKAKMRLKWDLNGRMMPLFYLEGL